MITNTNTNTDTNATEPRDRIGTTWDSIEGLRTVETFCVDPNLCTNGEPVYLVSTIFNGGGRTGMRDIVQVADLNETIDYETQQHRSQQARRVKQAEDAEREKIARAEREDLDGFTHGMTPMQRGRAISVLTGQNKLIRDTDTGQIYNRRDYIRFRVSQGYRPVKAKEKNAMALNGDASREYIHMPIAMMIDYAWHLISIRD